VPILCRRSSQFSTSVHHLLQTQSSSSSPSHIQAWQASPSSEPEDINLHPTFLKLVLGSHLRAGTIQHCSIPNGSRGLMIVVIDSERTNYSFFHRHQSLHSPGSASWRVSVLEVQHLQPARRHLHLLSDHLRVTVWLFSRPRR
jgi:hypothetical protein